MKVEHYIDGKEVGSDKEYYKSGSPFFGYNMDIPSLHEEHEEMLLNSLKKNNKISIGERRAILETLQNYKPSSEVLESVCKMTGIPISLVQTRIDEGKDIALRLARAELKDGGNKTVFAAVSPNDPREPFYFAAHLILAGNPSILKLSKREPALGTDIVKYLGTQGLPPGLLNIVHCNTANTEEQKILSKIMSSIDTLIVMGDSCIRNDQISFYAEHSRGLVVDADAAIPHLKKSVLNPGSCLAEHNYIVVGRENYEKVVRELSDIYSQLCSGDIMNPRTTRGLIEEEVIAKVGEILSMGRANDTIKIKYPRAKERKADKVTRELIEGGVLVEHYSEDLKVGVNPMMDTRLPLYITGVRYVPSIEDALRDLHAAQASIGTKNRGGKSMALGVYGDANSINRKDLESIAYDIHINESPLDVKGIYHQGINLNEVLTR